MEDIKRIERIQNFLNIVDQHGIRYIDNYSSNIASADKLIDELEPTDIGRNSWYFGQSIDFFTHKYWLLEEYSNPVGFNTAEELANLDYKGQDEDDADFGEDEDD